MRKEMFFYLKSISFILFMIFFNSCSKEDLSSQVSKVEKDKTINKTVSTLTPPFYTVIHHISPNPGTGEYPAPSKGFNFTNTRWYRNCEGKIIAYAYAQAFTSASDIFGDNCHAQVQVMLIKDNQVFNNYREEVIEYGVYNANATVTKTWIFEPSTNLNGVSIVAEGWVWGCFKPYPTTLYEISWSETHSVLLPSTIPTEGSLTTPNIILSVQNCNPKINWQSIVNATQYEVWRKIDNGSYELIATLSSCNFIDNEVITKPIKQSWFYYKVIAKNICSSAYSNVVSIQGQMPL